MDFRINDPPPPPRERAWREEKGLIKPKAAAGGGGVPEFPVFSTKATRGLGGSSADESPALLVSAKKFFRPSTRKCGSSGIKSAAFAGRNGQVYGLETHTFPPPSLFRNVLPTNSRSYFILLLNTRTYTDGLIVALYGIMIVMYFLVKRRGGKHTSG